jgi:hypothetical protein
MLLVALGLTAAEQARGAIDVLPGAVCDLVALGWRRSRFRGLCGFADLLEQITPDHPLVR